MFGFPLMKPRKMNLPLPYAVYTFLKTAQQLAYRKNTTTSKIGIDYCGLSLY